MKKRRSFSNQGIAWHIILLMGTVISVTGMTLNSVQNASAVDESCATALVLYVNHAAFGADTGRSWAEAYRTLQDALADPCLTHGSEIWVAAGVYYPDEGANQPANDRLTTFQLKNGIALYGGFAGDETQRESRNWQSNITVLSGDLEQNDGTDPAGLVLNPDAITGSNAYHVVTTQAVSTTTRLDGFVITGGKAEHSSEIACQFQCGGAIFNEGGSPTLANLTISGNRAKHGGGIYNAFNRVSLTNVVITNNYASAQGGGIYNEESELTFSQGMIANNKGAMGGGIYSQRSQQQLSAITISNNMATQGGAMFNTTNHYHLVDVVITGNQATQGGGIYNNVANALWLNVIVHNNRSINGGGLYSRSSKLRLLNTIVNGNLATSGGGVYNNNDTAMVLTNSTISGNRASDSGGGIYNRKSHPILTNVILWGNKANLGSSLFNESESAPTIQYSLVEGGFIGGQWNLAFGIDGGHNLDRDPWFVEAPNATAAPTTLYNVRLRPGSPAIDAGANDGMPTTVTTDAAGQARISNGLIDLGAYEESGLAPTPTATLPPAPTATASQPVLPATPTTTPTALPTATATTAPVQPPTHVPETATAVGTANEPPVPTATPTPTPAVTLTSTSLPSEPTAPPLAATTQPGVAQIMVTIERQDTAPIAAGSTVSCQVTVTNVGQVLVTLNAVHGAAKHSSAAQVAASDCNTPSPLPEGASYTCTISWQMPAMPDGYVEYEVTALGQDPLNQFVTARASTLLPITSITAVADSRFLYLPIIVRG